MAGGEAAARAALAAVAADGHGRLVAFLARRARDIGLAEDAVADAVRAALEQWAREGVPQNPEAWLLTAARRRLVDGFRRAEVRARHEDAVRAEPSAREVGVWEPEALEDTVPDERLGLMLAVTHPAIDRAVHAPLILQVVLGLPAERIARAFLVSPTALGQRLVRAKAKIRDAGIPFAVPARRVWPERLEGLLDAVYAAYATAWAGAEVADHDVAAEALRLSAVLLDVLPDEPEVLGLRALLLHTEARRAARRDGFGRYVPLSEQDPARWDAALAGEANALLSRAARQGMAGRYQIEAAIQGAMAARGPDGRPPWRAVVRLYDALLTLAPSLGAVVARAAAVGEAEGAEAGLAALEGVVDAGYQPLHATRAPLLAAAGRVEEARAAYDRAIEGGSTAEVRAFLRARRP
jgi:predicted RNA polymerase sigma factor